MFDASISPADSSTLRVDTTVIKQRVPILLKYLDSDTEKELQALYALQASIVKLDQPPSKCVVRVLGGEAAWRVPLRKPSCGQWGKVCCPQRSLSV